MKTFHESDRHDYSTLNRDTWVLELGGHKGVTARILAQKYGCKVICYEPIQEFKDEIVAMLAADSRLKDLIVPICAGVGATERKETFKIHGDYTGIVCGEGQEQQVTIVPIDTVLKAWTDILGKGPELLAINIEGMEFEVLDAMLDHGLESQVAHIQVQPHSVIPHAAARWAGIRNRLLMNFRITSEDPNLDTGWLLMERK